MATGEQQPVSLIHFGAFEFDLAACELRKGGVQIKLQGQPCQVLVALLENAGRVVTREELRDRLWPKDTFVDFDHSLNIAVNKIRDALDDQAASPRFVETIPRRGYRFLASIEPVATGPDAGSASLGGAVRTGLPVQRLLLSIAAMLIAAVAAFAAWRAIRIHAGPYWIAVLPLQNLNPEPGSEYFSDGLTDEIIHHLSLIDGLEVKSRVSSFAFKDRPKNMREVGRQLGIDLVLEGSVLRHEDRLRITADLVRVTDDATMWSARYDRELGDVLAIQDEIARSVVNQLRLQNVGSQRRYNSDVNTYDLYLRAETLANEDAPGNGPRLQRAIELFQQVVARQPDFAPAHAGMADTYATLRNRGRSREAGQKMRLAAERAIDLDPLLPQASATLGLARAANLAWSEAEQAFRRALQLDPNLSHARKNFAIYMLLPEGKVAEALQQVRKAADLDPMSASCQAQLAFVLLRAGQYGEALDISRRVLAVNPHDAFAGQLQARALLLEGKPRDALAILEKQGPPSHGYLGYAYASVGRRGDAERLAAEEDPAAARHQVLIYAALGERERTFEALQKLAEMDDFMADVYPGEPELASLRDDSRMKDFRRQRNLP